MSPFIIPASFASSSFVFWKWDKNKFFAYDKIGIKLTRKRVESLLFQLKSYFLLTLFPKSLVGYRL